MNFDLDEDRELLQTSTRELMERSAPLEVTRAIMERDPDGFPRDLYRQLANLGYVGVTLPDVVGGAGFGVIGLAAVVHQMGRVAFPGPYLDLVLAAEALFEAGGEAGKDQLRGLLAGERTVVLARRESLTPLEPRVPEARFRRGRATGTKRFVPHGGSADALLVTTAEGLVLVSRPAASDAKSRFDVTPQPTMDHAQRFAEIAFDAPGILLADAEGCARVLARVDRLGALGAAAFLLGLAERSLELTTAYLTEREAFGRPIGSFQSLQHRAADMLLKVASSRSAVYRAAWAVETDVDEAPLLVPVAKAYAGDAAAYVCAQAIQLHGGVGFTWEFDQHIFYKRAMTLVQLYGSTRAQLDAVLAARGI